MSGPTRRRPTSAPARPGQDTPTGTVGTDVNWHFVLDSPDVAGKAGTQFGIEFRLEGTPAGDGVTLHAAFTFPPQGIRNPNTGDMMHTAKVAFPNMKIGALCLVGYGFDNAWEIVPGVWTEQIWYQGSFAGRAQLHGEQSGIKSELKSARQCKIGAVSCDFQSR